MKGRRAAAVGLFAVAGAGACRGDSERTPRGDPRPAAGAAARVTPGPAARAETATDSGDSGAGRCPRDGRWRPCSVIQRLEQAGLVPNVDSAGPDQRPPFLTGTPLRIALGRGAVQVFLYDDSARAAREVAALDTLRVALPGQQFDWGVPPTLVRSSNLVAVLLTQNEHQIERLRLALEAGPPQPTGDRP